MPFEVLPFTQHVEFRLVGPRLLFGGGDTPELTAWLRLRDGRPVDAAALAILVDALPPALYACVTVPMAVPTVEMQVAFFGEQLRGGWVLARIRTRHAAGGWCVDDSEVWSADGRLLAQARQTRRVLEEFR